MILSASRRTDIPARYAVWFLRRLEDGLFLVPNPHHAKLLYRIAFTPGDIDVLVFWTKNPRPMFDQGILDAIDRFGRPYYFQFTLTPYGDSLEPHLPPIAERIEIFQRLAGRLGVDRVVWRYDPVVVTDTFSETWHAEKFALLCDRLAGSTRRCIFSFVGNYRHLKQPLPEIDEPCRRRMATMFSRIAAEFHLPLAACCETFDVDGTGIEHASCIDRTLIERLLGRPIRAVKDKGQRAACRCVESIDIGMYDSCPHGCIYCYANRSASRVARCMAAHDPDSPMLIGRPRGDETVIDRDVSPLRAIQPTLF